MDFSHVHICVSVGAVLPPVPTMPANASVQCANVTALATQVTGYEVRGHNLPAMPIFVQNPGQCRSSCLAQSTCVAFTYETCNVSSGVACWLKSQVVLAPPDVCRASGAVAVSTIVPPPQPTPSQLSGYDLIGNDLAGMPVPAGTMDECAGLCLAKSTCVAFSFHTCNDSSHFACWLKSDVGLLSASACQVSGSFAETLAVPTTGSGTAKRARFAGSLLLVLLVVVL